MSFDLTNFWIALGIVVFLIACFLIVWRTKMDQKTKKFLAENPNIPDKVKEFLSANPRREVDVEMERLRELQAKPYLTQGEAMEVEMLLKKKYELSPSKTWGG